MFKKASFKSLNNFGLLSFALLISTAFIFGVWATPAQADPLTATADKATSAKKEKKIDAQKSVVTKASTADITKPAKDKKSGAKSATTKLAPGTKININTADKAALEALPEIGQVKAKAIIDGRPYKSIEDIMKVKGIKQKIFDGIKDYLVI